MKANYNITQGTEEWHNIRYAKIGGTLSKGLFIESDTLMLDLLAEMVEPIQLDDDSYESKDMMRGVELEPLARQELSKYIGVELIECGWLQCEEIDILGISPDGISQCETISAEIKCPQAKKHTSTIYYNEIPKDNIHQCLHYFTINPKLEKHYFCSFRPESIKTIFVKELTRESLIDLGTKAKPNIKTIEEWVSIAKDKAIKLQADLKIAIESLNF
jgi:hypothetical protein